MGLNMASPFDYAWALLKALPAQQFITTDEDYNYLPEMDGGGYTLGTMHPAALGMARRQQEKSPFGQTQVQRLSRPDTGVHPREGKEQDIKTYGARVNTKIQPNYALFHNHPEYFNSIEPNYPPRDPIYMDTPLELQ